MQKYSTDSCLTLDGSNAKMCDTAKRRQREERKKGLCAIGFKSNNCMHVWIRVIVQIFEPLCARVCVHVHLHNEWGARRQQLGMPSSVLLSSINDQSGPSGEREPPTTKTWH